jgi:uncharacterized membrane protein
MFKELIFSASSVLSTGVIGEMLTKWENAGFFSYLIPFLIIFALVFGILSKVDPFKGNKGIYAILALTVGVMSLRFEFVPLFFSQVFPRLGVGLAIILSLFIVVGLFIDTKNKAINYVLLGIGVIIFAMVLIQSTAAVGWQSGQWWDDNWQMIVGAIFIFVVIAIIVGVSNPSKAEYTPVYAMKS